MQSATDVKTILFTDIEGSTRLWEQDAARMSKALGEHDKLARAAVADNGGTVVKMVGDGMYAVFNDPLDAVGTTIALQRALGELEAAHGLPLRIRCGVHVGVVEHRDNDLFGSPVNRAARIMSAAHGGQILLSQAVAEQVQSRLSAPASLRDLGGVRLRDLATPERLFQIVHPDLRADFPALRSLEVTPNNLPQQTTSFIGRERELAEAKKLLESTRLLTLLGMGGMGKTRLSLQIAADVMDDFPDGAWFIDLAPVRDHALVPNEVAQVLNIPEEPGRPLVQTLCAHLKSRRLMLVLDNCEHLVSACADLANALLRGAADIKIVATSREALRVPGEQTYPVLPLALPDRKAGFEVLARSEAVQLFIERARLHKPGFALTESEAAGIVELCARVEGIPLALELAAARVHTLSIAEINRRLNDRYKLLSGGSRVLLERQQTLRALVGWSYDLLQESECIFFDRLSVFVGGFDLPAAEAICGADPLDPDDVMDLLASLVEKSLVMVEQKDGETRYRLLETICDYARERLIKRDDVAATATRHCQHFLAVAKIARQKIQTSEQAEWTRRVELDLDNLRAAMSLALEGGVDPVIAVKFAVALQGFWILRGYATEGRNLLRAALARPEVLAHPVGHAFALYVGAALADSQSDDAEAEQMLEECLALRRGNGSPVEIAATLSTLSLVHLHRGDAASARAGEQEAIKIFREAGDRIGEAIGLLHLGEIGMYVGDDESARACLEQSLPIAHDAGHGEVEAECERLLGELALDAGDMHGARERFARALGISRGAEDTRGEAIALWYMGRAELAAGIFDVAEQRLATALAAFQSFRMNAEALGCLEDFATLLRVGGEVDKAVRLYAAIEAARERLALPRRPRAVPGWEGELLSARAALGDAAFEAAWTNGSSRLLDETIDAVLATREAGAEIEA
ncbi:MAG TPA: adenylate/guanylate cyclase domain-containing protein [Casimicrobiaceae bacterium]